MSIYTSYIIRSYRKERLRVNCIFLKNLAVGEEDVCHDKGVP